MMPILKVEMAFLEVTLKEMYIMLRCITFTNFLIEKICLIDIAKIKNIKFFLVFKKRY